MRLKPCCVWLKNILSQAGESGSSVIASLEMGGWQFFIQARPFTRHQAETLPELERDEATRERLAPLYRDERGRLAPIHVQMRLPIQFCPCCGTDLRKLAASQRSAFDDLAREHLPFVDR
jgi:hypothetical protein